MGQFNLIGKPIKINPGLAKDSVQMDKRNEANSYIMDWWLRQPIVTGKHSIEYDDWDGDGVKVFQDGFSFHRTPFMKDVIKTDIAKSVQVPDLRFGEDHQWSKLIKPLLKTEHHIPEQIYHYIYISNQTFEERYGYDKH